MGAVERRGKIKLRGWGWFCHWIAKIIGTVYLLCYFYCMRLRFDVLGEYLWKVKNDWRFFIYTDQVGWRQENRRLVCRGNCDCWCVCEWVMCLMAYCVAALLYFLLKAKWLSWVQKENSDVIRYPNRCLLREASRLLLLTLRVSDLNKPL